MRIRHKITIMIQAIVVVILSGEVGAQDFEKAKYKLRADYGAFYSDEVIKKEALDGLTPHNAGKGSKFFIYSDIISVDKIGKGHIIGFKKVRKPKCATGSQSCPVASTREFYFLFTEKNDDALNIDHYFRKNFSIDHGLLVVPWKFRTKDGTLSGESTIGYYVGLNTEVLLGSGTAFVSTGLSRLAVTDVNQEVEFRNGVTLAGGIILADTDNFQVAFVAGVDHLGGNAGDDWDYEDDLWLSFAIGYNFANPD